MNGNLFKELKTFFLNSYIINTVVALIFSRTFAKVISSLVTDIVLPLVSSVLFDKVNLTTLTIPVKGININYGVAINNFVVFLISIFILFFAFIRPLQKTIKEADKENVTEEIAETVDEIKSHLKKSNPVYPYY